MIPAFTRRRFLNLAGAAGGSAAVYQMAMGLAWCRPWHAPSGRIWQRLAPGRNAR